MAWEIVGETGETSQSASSPHSPVMALEVLQWLRPRSGGFYVDCTVGYCGHALAILTSCPPDGILLGIDRDQQAVDSCRQRLRAFGQRVWLVKAHFMELKTTLMQRGIQRVDGILFDLGVSSPQLDEPSRGFSFRSDGPLDMRMDQGGGPTAADIVNGVDEGRLADMIYRLGEERYSRRIARAIVGARRLRAITATNQLTAVIESAVPAHYRRGRIHCATRTFQALRIAVNGELDHLEASLRDAADVLAPGARLCVISFHSLEDRIVKHTFKSLAAQGNELDILTKRPQMPSEDELNRNPRSRSAKLRVLQRLMKEGHA